MQPRLLTSALSLLVGLAAAGCGSSPAHPAESPSVQADSGAPGATSTATSPSRLRPLFGDATHPTVFRAAASLAIGMPIADARRAAPPLFAKDPQPAPGLGDVTMQAHADFYGHLGSLTMAIGCATALDDVTRLWGEPESGDDTHTKAKLYWWFDPSARLRATLAIPDTPGTPGTCQLTLDRYMPLAELLGPGDAKLGFEREVLSGMSSADIARVFSDYLSEPGDDACKSEILVLPPVEYDPTFTRIHLYCGHDGVGSFDVIVNYGTNPALRNEVIDLLSRKFGRPTAKGTMFVFPPSTRAVRLKDDASMKDLTIGVSRN
jgi:hypothetical protein